VATVAGALKGTRNALSGVLGTWLFLGAAVFVILSDRAAAANPFHWLFALGLVLILVVRFAPSGLLSAAEQVVARAMRRRGGA